MLVGIKKFNNYYTSFIWSLTQDFPQWTINSKSTNHNYHGRYLSVGTNGFWGGVIHRQEQSEIYDIINKNDQGKEKILLNTNCRFLMLSNYKNGKLLGSPFNLKATQDQKVK